MNDTNAQIIAWHNLKNALNALKSKEQEMRKQIVNTNFLGSGSGRHRVKLDGNKQLVADIKDVYKITKNEAVEPADYSHLPQMLSGLPEAKVHELIKWEPKLSMRAYNSLTQSEKAIVDNILVIKPGAPTLEVKDVKD